MDFGCEAKSDCSAKKIIVYFHFVCARVRVRVRVYEMDYPYMAMPLVYVSETPEPCNLSAFGGISEGVGSVILIYMMPGMTREMPWQSAKL